MELTGCCFALAVPPAWRMETNDGVVIATSDESFAGFTPNVVLRESRLRRPEPTSPEAASQANLAVLSDFDSSRRVEPWRVGECSLT